MKPAARLAAALAAAPLFPMLLLGLGLVAAAAAAYLADPDDLWRDPYHDRNSHFASALTLALALREGDLLAVAAELARPSVWPPLQAAALGAWMSLAGPALHWAILPATLGWVVTLVSLARLGARGMAEPARGALAGGIAVALAATSPAFARLGTDAMMEVPGAALTLLLLLAATARPVPWRWLAALLTLLALLKYNYWLMAAAALVLAEAGAILPWALRLLRAVDRRRLLEDAPLRALALGLALLAGLLPIDPAWRLLGIMLLPAHLAAIAWGCALLAAARAWRRRGAGFDAALGAPARTLLAWHALPIALWLLIPGKLPALLGFLSPAHAGATAPHGVMAAIGFHGAGFAQGFSAHPGIALLVLGLALIGARLAPRPVTVFAALGTLAVVLHPQLQWRFQASVLPAIWALAGFGAAALLPRRAAILATLLPPLLAAGLLALPEPPLADAAAIRRPDRPRDLDLVAAWNALPIAPGGVFVLSSFGRADLFDWSIRLRCRCLAPIEQPPWMELGDGAALAALAMSPAPALLAVTMPAPYPIGGRAEGLDLPVAALLRGQQRYALHTSAAVPSQGAEVQWWRATEPPAAPPPGRRGLIEIAAALLALASLGSLLLPRRR